MGEKQCEDHQVKLQEALEVLQNSISGYSLNQIEYLLYTNQVSQGYFRKMWTILATEKLKRESLEKMEIREPEGDGYNQGIPEDNSGEDIAEKQEKEVIEKEIFDDYQE